MIVEPIFVLFLSILFVCVCPTNNTQLMISYPLRVRLLSIKIALIFYRKGAKAVSGGN